MSVAVVMFITDNNELLLSEIIPIEEHYDGTITMVT